VIGCGDNIAVTREMRRQIGGLPFVSEARMAIGDERMAPALADSGYQTSNGSGLSSRVRSTAMPAREATAKGPGAKGS